MTADGPCPTCTPTAGESEGVDLASESRRLLSRLLPDGTP